MRRTKIVCTIGPASKSRLVISKMLSAGMDVSRLNFSHGDYSDHLEYIARLREVSGKRRLPLAILQDLCGPKVRLGELDAPISVAPGSTVSFGASGRDCVPLPVPELLAALSEGAAFSVDDGAIGFIVTECHGAPQSPERRIIARSVQQGVLKSHKGVSARGIKLEIPAVTDKDKEDLRFGLAHGVDWVAASFVQHPGDITPIRDIMDEMGVRRPVVAKIETFQAVRNLEAIIEAADGIMVARGDLGVEMQSAQVPIIQKRIIKLCNRVGKPVITATQMLESMISAPRPTRAESADVANAIYDGTDALMLSAETAAGQYPAESARTMALIARMTEHAIFAERGAVPEAPRARSVTEAVARATANIARDVGARAILCATTSGSTARSVAQQRPEALIFGATTEEATYRQLMLSWGVIPHIISGFDDTDSMMRATIDAAQRSHIVRRGDLVVLTAGVPINNPGTTNLIRVHRIGEPMGHGAIEA